MEIGVHTSGPHIIEGCGTDWLNQRWDRLWPHIKPLCPAGASVLRRRILAAHTKHILASVSKARKSRYRSVSLHGNGTSILPGLRRLPLGLLPLHRQLRLERGDHLPAGLVVALLPARRRRLTVAKETPMLPLCGCHTELAGHQCLPAANTFYCLELAIQNFYCNSG